MKLINDNVRPFDTIGERDIHAYIDGQLDERRRRKVEAYLAQNPDIAEEVEDYLQYNAVFKHAYSHDIDDSPVPLRLLSVLNRPVKRIWPAVARNAAVIVLCALSAGAGWVSAYSPSATNAPASSGHVMVDRFLQQIAINSEQASLHEGGQPLATLDIDMSGHMDPLNWLTQKVALEMQAPDLNAAGYSLEGRQLINRGGQEFVELTYRDQQGQPVNLYMRTRWDKNAPSIEFAQQNGMSIAHWQEGPLVYALAGALDEDNATQIADLIRQGMITDRSERPVAAAVRQQSDVRGADVSGNELFTGARRGGTFGAITPPSALSGPARPQYIEPVSTNPQLELSEH